jgi:hypothetical protein
VNAAAGDPALLGWQASGQLGIEAEDRCYQLALDSVAIVSGYRYRQTCFPWATMEAGLA